jgi:hypothetical protein
MMRRKFRHAAEAYGLADVRMPGLGESRGCLREPEVLADSVGV